MVVLDMGQKTDCGGYKTEIVFVVDTIKEISESLKYSDRKRHRATRYGRLH